MQEKFNNHLRSNDYEVCTAVALCFPNILEVMVLENINLSSDRNRATVTVSNGTDVDFCHQSVIYTDNSAYFNCTLILYVHWT